MSVSDKESQKRSIGELSNSRRMSDDSSEISEPSTASEPRDADSEDEWVPESDSGELSLPARDPRDEEEGDNNEDGGYESQAEEEVRYIARRTELHHFNPFLPAIHLLVQVSCHHSLQSSLLGINPRQSLHGPCVSQP